MMKGSHENATFSLEQKAEPKSDLKKSCCGFNDSSDDNIIS